jgi:hypothetical protein
MCPHSNKHHEHMLQAVLWQLWASQPTAVMWQRFMLLMWQFLLLLLPACVKDVYLFGALCPSSILYLHREVDQTMCW